MGIVRLTVSCCLALSLLAGWASPVLEGRVIKVAGGDSLVLLDSRAQEHPIRLAFVDAPSLAQSFGEESQAALASMTLGKPVWARLTGEDGQGRVIADVIEPGGRSVNLELIKRGLVWHDDFQTQTASERDTYRSALLDAQRARRGIWGLDRLEHPRDLRARGEQILKLWNYGAAACAALMLFAGVFALYGDRINSWLARHEEARRVDSERFRLRKIAEEAQEAERQRILTVANAEMDRLAAVRRQQLQEREQRAPLA